MKKDSRVVTGHFFVDHQVLAAEGSTVLNHYFVMPSAPLPVDIFLD